MNMMMLPLSYAAGSQSSGPVHSLVTNSHTYSNTVILHWLHLQCTLCQQKTCCQIFAI